MSISYFKQRDRFDFSKDTLDIGNPLSWKRPHFLKLLFKRIFAISEERIEEFYQWHLNYYFQQHPDGTEETFFGFLWDLIARQLQVLLLKDIYDEDHIRNEKQIKQLKKFTEILISHDQWNVYKSTEATVAAQEIEIHALTKKNSELTAELTEYRQFDGYIDIRDGQALALLDLFIKMQALETTGGDQLLITHAQNTWAKMISKYFREVDFSYTSKGDQDVTTVLTLEEKQYPSLVKNQHKVQPTITEEIPIAVTENIEKKKPALVSGKHVVIAENQKGISYHKLFAPYLEGALKITILDPYIRHFYQVKNVMEFMQMLLSIKPVGEDIDVKLVTKNDNFNETESTERFNLMKDSLDGSGINFEFEYDQSQSFHARSIETDTGWKILLDRGLDIFQAYDFKNPFNLANSIQEERFCKGFEVTYLKDVD